MAECYAKETKALFLMLVEAILESLGLEKRTETAAAKDEMESILEDGSQLMVVNCYPPCPQPDLTLGMPPHSDYGFLTLLLQDDVEGLQILHQDRWLMVRPIPGSFVVNVGDHLEVCIFYYYYFIINTTNIRIRIKYEIELHHRYSAMGGTRACCIGWS